MIIKVLLVLSIVAVAIVVMRGEGSARRTALGRLASLAFVACGVLAVLAPDLVTKLANAVGVGRGTDLVLYALVVAFLFSTVAVRRRFRHQDDRIAQLTRELALRSASPEVPARAASPAALGEMTSSPSIEFVVPYHGHPGWLQETVRSVLDQTDPHWRLRVVQDGPDVHDLGEWVDAQGDDRVVYVRNASNLGVAANFQRCLDLAEGSHLVLLGCDDRLQRQLRRPRPRDADRLSGRGCGPAGRRGDRRGRPSHPSARRPREADAHPECTRPDQPARRGGARLAPAGQLDVFPFAVLATRPHQWPGVPPGPHGLHGPGTPGGGADGRRRAGPRPGRRLPLPPARWQRVVDPGARR